MIPGLPGIELWIWPRHMLRVHGREVPLSRREGDLLSVLVSSPGRFFTAEELVAHSYGNPDDEPDYGCETVMVRIHVLRKKLDRHGVTIDLRGKKSGDRTYQLKGFGLASDWKPEDVGRKKLSPPTIVAIVSRWKGGEKEVTLAAEYGIHLRTIYKMLKAHRPSTGRFRRLNKNVASEIRARWKGGTGPKALAYEYGVSLRTVHRLIRPDRPAVH